MIPFALFGAYVGIKQLVQWRKEAREKRRDKEEIENRFEELRHDIRGIASYLDGLAEMPERKRLELVRDGLRAMRDFKYDDAITHFRECLGVGATQSQKIALLILIGNCFLSTSRLNEAEEHYGEAEVAARESNDKEGLSAILGNMGNVYRIKGELDKALDNYQKALGIDREIGHREGEAITLGNMGIVYGIKGDLDKALGHYQQALGIHGEISHREGEANALGNMGNVYQIKGELDKALEHHQQALEIQRETGHREGEAITLGNMGIVYGIKGELSKALEHFQQAVKLEPPGFIAGGDWSLLFLWKAHAGDKDGALAMLDEKRGDLPRPGRANTLGAWPMLFGVVEGLAVLGEREEAAKLYPLLLEAIDTGTLTSWASGRLLQSVAGMAAAAGGQWDEAEEHYRTALRQAHELPVVMEQPEVRRWYARMLIDRDGPGDREKARELLTEAIAMYRRIGMPKHVEMAEALLGEV